MNLEKVNKWLDEEFGVSYTKLEELYGFYLTKNMRLINEQDELCKKIEELEIENKKLKNENFKLDYQNTRIKGALFEFEMNYYQDNLKESNVA